MSRKIIFFILWLVLLNGFIRAFGGDKDISLTPINAPLFFDYEIPKKFSDGWGVGDLRKENFNFHQFYKGVNEILNGTVPDVDSLLVIRHGKIVFEEYFNGNKVENVHRLYSETKSVFSTVYGIAQDQGLLNLSEKIFDYYPEEQSKTGWDTRKNSITIGMLLSMTSGFDCTDAPMTGPVCLESMFQSANWLSFCLNLPLAHAPGTVWAYNGVSLTLLSDVISRKSRMSFPQYAEKYLLVPLDIRGTNWSVGPQGAVSVDSGLAWTSRDMAKLGQLYLNKGLWGGKRIVSESWIENSTTVHARPGGDWDDYGYLWYVRNMRFQGGICKVFWASGGAGQHIMVCPSADLVCVMTAHSRNPKILKIEDDFFQDFILGCFGK